MPALLDNIYAMRFVYLLTRKWTDMDAYKLGLIDENGNILSKGLRTSKEKAALTKFHILVFNLKKLLEKVPLGRSTVARYATALLLLKEHLSPALLNKNVMTETFTEHLKGKGYTKYLNELEGSTAGSAGSCTTGVDGVDGTLGLTDPSIKKSKKKSRQNLWKIKTY